MIYPFGGKHDWNDLPQPKPWTVTLYSHGIFQTFQVSFLGSCFERRYTDVRNRRRVAIYDYTSINEMTRSAVAEYRETRFE